MKKKFSLLALVMIAGLLIVTLAGCTPGTTPDGGTGGDGGATDGTVTVNLTNAASVNGRDFSVTLYPPGVPTGPTGYVGYDSDTIASGAATAVVKDADNDTVDYIATGGDTYTIFAFDTGDASGNPDGSSYSYETTVTIDGNTTVNLDFSDFTAMSM